MKISIVTATFNSSATIADTLESIKNQTHTDYEIIIQDGVSSDKTLEIVDSYRDFFGKRLRIVTEKDNGLYDAMNRGVSRATGDIFGILNSDDFYRDENVLADINKAFEENDIKCVYGDLVFVDAVNTNKVIRTWKGSQHYPGAFLKGWHPAHPTFYAKRECFKRFGGFDISLNVSADFELMLRFIERNNIKNLYMDRCFVCMRYGGESTGSIKKIILGNKNIRKALRKNGYDVSFLFFFLRRLSPKLYNIVKNKIKKTIEV